MRITITSRIFDPEPSAATYRLRALASGLVEGGHDVTVLTVSPGAAADANDVARPYSVSRFPVLRDSSGYVRGYLQYLSFDVPLFFRILFGRRADMIITEPPPTTGVFVRLAAALRRTPYAYYAADVWSDAAQQTGASKPVITAVRLMEKFALNGAALVLSVSAGVTERIAELGVRSSVTTVGNGVDAELLSASLTAAPEFTGASRPTFIYAGTASELHGAAVFIEALPAVLRAHPSTKLEFVGGGIEQENLQRLAERLGVAGSVSFEETVTAPELAPRIQAATAALASVRPGEGYDFAFPTKLYTAAVCGAPMVYAGVGPGVEFVASEVCGAAIGTTAAYDPVTVAEAMIAAADAPVLPERRRAVTEWAAREVSLRGVASRAVAAIERVR